MIDREMRKLLKRFKEKIPMGARGKTIRHMRQVYEMADADQQAAMKQTLKDDLDGTTTPTPEPEPDTSTNVEVYEFSAPRSLLLEGSVDASGGGDSGPAGSESGDGV